MIYVHFLAKFFIFLLTDFIFSFGMDVRIVKKDGWLNFGMQKRLENLALTGSTTGMQK